MSIIHRFMPRGELDARARLDAFVLHARSAYMGVLGLKNENFDRSVWSFDMRVLGAKRAKSAHIKFVRYELTAPRGEVEPRYEDLISEPFLSFAKALFLERLVGEVTQAVSDLQLAIRGIEHVARNRMGSSAHPALLSSIDIKAAARLLAELADASAYRRLAQLQMVVAAINKAELTECPIVWRNTLPKPRELRLDISQEAEQRRQEKMPSLKTVLSLMQLAIWALDGHLHRNMPAYTLLEDGVEEFTARPHADEKHGPVVLGLALCAVGLNCRVSELALMPCNPESTTLAKGELDSDGIAEDEDRFALRWVPVKGGAPMVKPFSKTLAPFAQLIVRKLKQFSAEPRRIARHYELHPNTLYLPEHLSYLRGKEWISAEELSRVVGIEVSSVLQWAKKNNVEILDRTDGKNRRSVVGYSFSGVESALIGMLPKGFPYIAGDLKFSEAMFCCFLNQSHFTRGTCRVIPSRIRQDVFEEVLTKRAAIERHKSIFELYGFFEDDGQQIDLTTHEFRHFWQTQLKGAGISEKLAAYAAGRIDVGHNEDYDLTNPKEVADLSFDIMDRSKTKLFELSALAIAQEVLATTITQLNPSAAIVSFSESALVSRDSETGALNVQGCHLTKYGICKHNYISSGCKKFMECLECDELLCVKGVARFEKNAAEKAAELRKFLIEYREQVIEDVKDGVDGADNWRVMVEKQLAKLDALVDEIYTNQDVPNGTVVRLTDQLRHTSALGQALVERLGLLMEGADLTPPKLVTWSGV